MTTLNLKLTVEKFESGLVIEYLKHSVSVTDAAHRLGLTRETMTYKMKRYGLRGWTFCSHLCDECKQKNYALLNKLELGI